MLHRASRPLFHNGGEYSMTFGLVRLVIASTTPDSPEARIRKWVYSDYPAKRFLICRSVASPVPTKPLLSFPDRRVCCAHQTCLKTALSAHLFATGNTRHHSQCFTPSTLAATASLSSTISLSWSVSPLHFFIFLSSFSFSARNSSRNHLSPYSSLLSNHACSEPISSIEKL